MSQQDDSHDRDKTSIVSGDTLKIRLKEVVDTPPAVVLLMGPAHMVGKQWPITKSDVYVGRVSESHVFVDDRSLSKRHGKLALRDSNEVVYEDLSSTNGTEVNGLLIPANTPIKLKNNDQLKLGNVIFKFLEKGNIETIATKGTYDRTQIDPLTQAYNKGALMTTGEEVFKRAKLTNTAMTLIVFDLDHFKKINDTHGHPAGDYVLKELAAVIQNRLIRQGDFFARFGGEEFCLLLIGGTMQRGVEVAERIRITIEKNEFIFDGKKIPVTISAGVSTLEKTMNSWNELFEKADKAAYQSKAGGRNRVSAL